MVNFVPDEEVLQFCLRRAREIESGLGEAPFWWDKGPNMEEVINQVRDTSLSPYLRKKMQDNLEEFYKNN